MSTSKKWNHHKEALLAAGFARYRYTTGNGYGGKDRKGPPTWRKGSRPLPAVLNGNQVTLSHWRYIEKTRGGWVCYVGAPTAPEWSSPQFKDSTAALVYAELANWGGL